MLVSMWNISYKLAYWFTCNAKHVQKCHHCTTVNVMVVADKLSRHHRWLHTFLSNKMRCHVYIELPMCPTCEVSHKLKHVRHTRSCSITF